MNFRRRLQFFNIVTGMTLHALLSFCIIVLLLMLWWRSFGGPADGNEQARQHALELLRGLKISLLEKQGDRRMQSLFPEGACFTWTLYGLAWANVAESVGKDDTLRAETIAEMHRALEQNQMPLCVSPFDEQTQVRRGVFWLGQRNLLLARTLELTREKDRRTSDVEEFHRNSSDLHRAFMARPTHHLDSYEGMCWPADNVTALASLAAHDQIYGTNYRTAFVAWKDWTTSNSCELTGLPAGRLYSDTGQLIEPARGCANSWIVPLISEIDPEFAQQLYTAYRNKMTENRLGFRMFREYPATATGWKADVDSGPVIWGAGVTATGVGLAAARAMGDTATERDIRDLARMFGWPRSFNTDEGTATWHMMGALPVGDAFLAWGWSMPRGQLPDGIADKSNTRVSFHALMITLLLLLIAQYALLTRRTVRRLRKLRSEQQLSHIEHVHDNIASS